MFKRITIFSNLGHFHGDGGCAQCSHHPILTINPTEGAGNSAKDSSTSPSVPSYTLEQIEDPTIPKGDVLHGIPIQDGG
jgi:hypothetical protein